jgi:hypothetical protein
MNTDYAVGRLTEYQQAYLRLSALICGQCGSGYFWETFCFWLPFWNNAAYWP